jgi:hypothetical protein
MSTATPEETAMAQALIPGAYERRPATARRSGAMGGRAYGSLNPPSGPPTTIDAATIAERRKEGGGLSQRRPRRNSGGRS